jgi:hypothetical protein
MKLAKVAVFQLVLVMLRLGAPGISRCTLAILRHPRLVLLSWCLAPLVGAPGVQFA